MRMNADEFERLEDDGFRYELIDGVVVMSPTPNFGHQKVQCEVLRQIANYLIENPVGEVVGESSVFFDAIRVYEPDLVFVRNEAAPPLTGHIRAIPGMILEVLSPGTAARDLKTKRADYERFGVLEYWLFDPMTGKFTFLRLTTVRGRSVYQAVVPKGSKFASKAIPGFILDIAAVKRVLKG
jgi:Uma2 family endonuclease